MSHHLILNKTKRQGAIFQLCTIAKRFKRAKHSSVGIRKLFVFKTHNFHFSINLYPQLALNRNDECPSLGRFRP